MRKFTLTLLPLFSICLSSCGASYEKAKERAKQIIETAYTSFLYTDALGVGTSIMVPNSDHLKRSGVIRHVRYADDNMIEDATCNFDLDKKYVHSHFDMHGNPFGKPFDIYVFEKDGYLYKCSNNNYENDLSAVKSKREFSLNDFLAVRWVSPSFLADELSQSTLLSDIAYKDKNHLTKFLDGDYKRDLSIKTKNDLDFYFSGYLKADQKPPSGDEWILKINELLDIKNGFVYEYLYEEAKIRGKETHVDSTTYSYDNTPPEITEVDLSKYKIIEL